MASHPVFFKQIPIEGKGVGMTAAIDIPNYAIILTEIPLITRPRITPSTNFAVENKQIQEKFCGLPIEKQRAFLSLYRANCRPGFSNKPFLDIFTTNSFGLGEDSTQSGVFELCSRFNHSCQPNAQFRWNPTTRMEEVRAMRTIAAGDEITVSYGFECRCEACTLPPKELEESDRQRTLLAAMDQEVGNGVLIMIDPARALGMCKKSIEILEIEGMHAEISRIQYDAFQICIAHGDLARASVFAEMSAIGQELHSGVSEESKHLRAMAKNPTQHMLYGMDMRWKTTLKQKKKPGTAGFEQWLWSSSRGVEICCKWQGIVVIAVIVMFYGSYFSLRIMWKSWHF